MKLSCAFVIVFYIIWPLTGHAQDPAILNLKSEASKQILKNPKDTVPEVWKVGAMFSVNLAQGSLSNWAAGGDDFSLTVSSYASAHAFYSKGKNHWDNKVEINLGYVNTTSLGARKNDDRIDVLSKYGYSLNSRLNLTGQFNFRSQFFKGYSFNKDSSGRSVATLSSNFLAPAYILVGAGIDYHPTARLSFFISPLTYRLTIVKDDSLSAKGDYGVMKGAKSTGTIGAYASLNYNTAINKLISYTGRADLFSNYKSNPQNVDCYITNLFSIQLSKILSASWNVDLIYDDDVKNFGGNLDSPRLQFNSLIGIGVLVKM